MSTPTRQPAPTSGTAASAAAKRPAAITGAPRNLARRMDAEWSHLVSSPAGQAALRRWARREPAVAGLTDLRHLQHLVRTDLERGDAVLAALVRLAACDGGADTLATRVVIQLLIPGALRLASNLAKFTGDWSTAESLVFAELAIGVRCFPWRRRRHRIAANLLLDCRQRLTRSLRRSRHETAAGLLQQHADPYPVIVDAVHDAITARALLTWARHTGIINDLETRLLLANRGHDIPIPALTGPFGRSRTALYAIRAAAEQKLRTAVTTNSHHMPHTLHTHRRLATGTPTPYPLPRPRSSGIHETCHHATA